MFKRSIGFPSDFDSFFLWGPRQSGKTSILNVTYPNALRIDLLSSEEFIKYSQSPSRLYEELMALPRGKTQTPFRIIIDEVQKVPALLDEVQRLIETKRFAFGLCGSSARKLKRGSANLLGGRALRLVLNGLTAEEIGKDFDLIRALNHGYLPSIYLSDAPKPRLRAYVTDYLKEEIAAEGLVRNLPSFSNFLELSALCDTEQLSYSSIARDLGVSSPTVKSYFDILTDTLIATTIPAYRHRPKRRIETSPKIYFFDVGVVNHLTKRPGIEPGSELFGKAFENWVFHELRSYRDYHDPDAEIFYWKLSTGVEVDFIIDRMRTAVEAKATRKIHSDHLKGLRELKIEHPSIKKRMIVCLEKNRRITDDGIEIIPYREWAFCLSELFRA
jgi:predicted AAA+ superfamily ATPase